MNKKVFSIKNVVIVLIIVIVLAAISILVRSNNEELKISKEEGGSVKIETEKEDKTFVCGESYVTDFEGNSYKIVKIGDLCWMSENLNSKKDKNGNKIPRECFNDDVENCDLYGGLYDWKTATVACPQGWKLPSDEDYKAMESALGMDEEEIDFMGWRYSGDIFYKIIAGGESGFDALMAGHFDGSYQFKTFGSYGFFWTSTPHTRRTAIRRYLGIYEKGFVRNMKEREFGFSVRCIKED